MLLFFINVKNKLQDKGGGTFNYHLHPHLYSSSDAVETQIGMLTRGFDSLEAPLHTRAGLALLG